MNRVAVIDYGAGNLDSVCRALQECGADPRVTTHPRDLELASRIVLPGVGVFAEGMRGLRERGYEEALQEQVRVRDLPFLGICLGMQLMASSGIEGGRSSGLGWIPGEVVRLEPRAEGERVPHVGWNEVQPCESGCGLFSGLDGARDFYFVHSFHLRPGSESTVAAWTPFAGRFASAVRRGRMMGVQFHPEKSQKAGFQVLRNFLSL